MKLEKTVKIILLSHPFFYIWAWYITYTSSHDGKDDFSGLNVFLPLSCLILTAFVAVLLLAFYAVKLLKKKQKPDVLIVSLVVVSCLMALSYDWAESSLSTMSGNEFLPANDFDFYNN